jgi:hypothetical protein
VQCRVRFRWMPRPLLAEPMIGVERSWEDKIFAACRVIMCCLQRGRCGCAFPGSGATDNQRSEARGKHPHPTNRAVASLQAGARSQGTARHGPAPCPTYKPEHAGSNVQHVACCLQRSFVLIFLVTVVVASIMRSGPACIMHPYPCWYTPAISVGDAGDQQRTQSQRQRELLHATPRPFFSLSVTGTAHRVDGDKGCRVPASLVTLISQ